MTLKEFNQKRPFILAVDCDGTLWLKDMKFPGCGTPRNDVIEKVKKFKKDGAYIILWTCRSVSQLEPVRAFCKEHGIVYDAINKNYTRVLVPRDAVLQNKKGVDEINSQDDLNKTVYILGLFSKTGNMLKSDYRDMKQWIDTLIQKLNDGYSVMTSPNKNSMKFIDSIMKKDPSIKMRNIGNVDLSHMTNDEKQKEIWKWTTIVLKK